MAMTQHQKKILTTQSGWVYKRNMDVPLIITLQHCWEAFIVLLPIASLAIVAYVTITLDKQ
jgi:hypothetical protein